MKILNKRRDEQGEVDLLMTLIAVSGILVIFLVMGSLMVNIISSKAGEIVASINDENVSVITSAVETGLIHNPTATQIELVRNNDTAETYSIYLWSEGNQEAYRSEPFALLSDNVTLTGTVKDYKVQFVTRESGVIPAYINEQVSIPGFDSMTRPIYDDATLKKSEITVYDSTTEKIEQFLEGTNK